MTETATPALARSTATMTVLTGVSRLTGFARVIVVSAVLGTTFLGNAYQTTNTMPLLIFELMAAGAFQAVLIPVLVGHRERGDDAEAERVAGSVFGLALAALSAVALLGMLLSPLVARLLFSGSDPAVRADQVRLGTIFLLIFLPQVVMYAAGMVSTAVLNAGHRFAVPAIAPAVNNVIVCAAYGLFWLARDGQAPSLDLTPLQIALLAGGTTAGVLGFCGLPLLAVVRSSFRLRPRFGRPDPEVRRLLRMAAWTAGLLAAAQLLTFVELLLANRVEGGVVALQIGWTFFLLPYALFAQPVLTALFPRISGQAARDEHAQVARSVETGTEMIALFVVPLSIALAATAPALCRGVLFGAIGQADAADVAAAVSAFAPGILGYSLVLFFARVLYAHGDARTPTVVTLAASAVAAVGMVLTVALGDEDWIVPVLAGWHAAAYTLAAVVIVRRIRRILPAGARPALLRRLRPQVLAAVPVVAVAVPLGRWLPVDSRPVALAGGAVLGGAVLGAYLLLTAALGGPHPRRMVAQLRSRGAA